MRQRHATLFRYDDQVRAALETIKARDGISVQEQIRRAVVGWAAAHDIELVVTPTPARHEARAARFARLSQDT